MRKLILILLLFVSAVVNGQTPAGYIKANMRFKWTAGIFDSALHVPQYNGTPSGIRTGGWVGDGAIGMDTTNHRMYIYSGGAWLRLASYAEAMNSWSLTGNAGTNTSTNFIGTTDAQPLMFRYNNLNAGSIGKSGAGTYLGIGAGENDNAEDDPNVGVGYYALYHNTTGSANSAVGASALASNTTGSGNSAVGVDALYNNTTGYNNSAVGASAGNNAKQKPDAKYQTLLGSSTYGTRDSITVLGASFIKETIVRGKLIDSTLSAGAGTKAVRWNEATGEFTYADTTAGGGGGGWSLTGNAGTTSSNFIGTTDNQPLSFRVNNRWAGRLTTSGNIFWGDSAGVNNIGYSNVAIGRGALRNDVGGINLVAIGDSALYNNLGDVGEEEGLQNTAVGSKALYSNTTGSGNTANGYLSLYSNTTGGGNTANGYRSLYSNTTGNYNTANGYQSLFSNTTGNYNTTNGYQSLYSNTTGSNNTANGLQSLFSNTTGNYNTTNGYYSLYSNTTGDNNVGIGYQSGYNAKQKVDAKNQILIGANTYGTRDSIAVIGASFMKETILRGKLIDSTLSAGAGTKAVRWNSSTGEFTYADTTVGGGGGGGLTIGTTTIASSATGSILYDSSGTLSRNADLYWDVSNKRLGIATRTPSAPIHVYKWGSSSPLIALTGMSGTLNIYADASTQFHWSENLVVDKDLTLGGGLITAYGKTYDWNAGSFINIQSIDFNGAGSRIKLAPDYNGGSTVANQGVIVKYTNPSSGNYPQAAFQAYSSSDDTDKSFLISSRGFGYLKNSKTDETVFYLKAAASQTANLLELKNSSSTILSSFDKDGKLYLGSSSAPTTTLQVNGTMAVNQGTDVASANNLAVVANSTEITGTTQVNLIANTGWVNGSQITLLLASGITIKNGQTTSGSNITILLDGAADFVTSAASSLTLLLCEVGGTQAWREISRRSY